MALSGKHRPASDGTFLNHTPLGLLLLACVKKIIALTYFKPLCFSSIHLTEALGSHQTRLLLYSARQKERLRSEGGSLVLPQCKTEEQQAAWTQTQMIFPLPIAAFGICSSEHTSPAADRVSPATRVGLNRSTAADQERTQGHSTKNQSPNASKLNATTS